MFKKLKNKLKDWTTKVSGEVDEVEESLEETPEEEVVEEKPKKSILKKLTKKKKEELPQVEVEKTVNEVIEDVQEKKAKEVVEDLPTEETKEEVPEVEVVKPKKKSFLKKMTSSKIEITSEDFEKYSEDLEMLLMENNVALEVAEKIVEDLKNKIVGEEIPKKELNETIEKYFKETLSDILIEPFDLIEKIKEKDGTYVVLFCGINGTGKTTSIAKIASKLKEENISCVLAAGDTFRAASIEQIKTHGENLGLEVIAHEYNSDPAAVGFDAIKHAKKENIKCVLIDTAGRMHTAKNLMSQIEKVTRVTNPDTKIFVGESTTGNDIVEQVKAFNESVGLDGIILSKADIDEKGGTALSVGYITKKPILYLGVGQEYKDLEKFDKEKFLEKLFSEEQ